MIEQFTVLLRVKQMREDRLLRELQQKRQEVRRAEEKISSLTEQVAKSAKEIPLEEERIYSKIMKRTVGMPDVELVKEKVVQLQERHQLLVDRLDRAKHLLKTLLEELAVVREKYRKAQREKDKFDMIMQDLRNKLEFEAAYKEDIEVEDMFSRAMKLPG